MGNKPFLMFFSLLFLVKIRTLSESCLSFADLQSLVDSLKQHNPNITNTSILEIGDIVSETYDSLDSIGTYLIEIDSKYDMQAYVSVDGEQSQQIKYDQQNSTIKSGFNAHNNLWLRFNSDLITITCNLQWRVKINCGTFVQIHLPFSPTPLIKTNIQNLTQPINIAIELLCAGTYHIWLIFSTRIGQVVKSVRPVFISYPFCQCE